MNTDSIKKNTYFKIGYQPTNLIPPNISTRTSAFTAVALTKSGLRGKAKGLDKKDPEQKKQISHIKVEADGLAKEIYKKVVKEADIILRVHVSEGFGRDEVAESFKANDVVNPEGKKGIEDAIIDVIEGTNPFVTNIEGRSLEELEDYESGATSIIVTGPGVESLGNCPDYYVDAIFTIVPKEKIQGFIDNPLDPELTASNADKIEEFLSRIAEANNINIGDLEVVVMEREREKQRLAALANLQKKYPGLELVTIKDGTVPHSLLSVFGRKLGKHKVVMTVGGAPEGFLNLAVASIFKEEGALGSIRICSQNINKAADGSEAMDLGRRYDFSKEEKEEIEGLRPQDAESIFKGEKLFTQEYVKGDVEGSFSFITDNGVFRIEGAEKLPNDSYTVNILRVGKIAGKPCAWFEKKTFSSDELDPFIVYNQGI
ncbi:MAG: fructose-bisphosphatase class II [Patescibacteria group bacterium]|nr:fructose-bisphosphatase class II [Patescibacteria group bacterium]